MTKNLVIVESPAKAKTIEKYLGAEFTVLSSIGHIRQIPTKTKDGTPAVDVKNDFKTVYEVDPDKRKTVTELRKATKSADTVWLATDEDREGEAIAWHLCEVLKLNPKETKRIVFHEITKDAITKAVKNPRTVDMSLVEAQQARQVLDRIVGFELSPVVWQKVPGGKSAGRVQSPAVRLLVEREREIRAFDSSYSFKVTAELLHNGDVVKAELPQRFDTEEEAKAFLDSLKGAEFTVSDVTTSPSKRNPAAPFTTSTLQQDANAKLGFGSRATMTAAQKLYQAGKITYMRTDSVNLSGQAIASAKKYITDKWGENYSQIRTYKTKNSGAQEAHEAIRPTNLAAETGSTNEYDQKLYDLIRRRTLASQMASAELEKTTVTITISSSEHDFVAKGEVVIFDGFMKVYGGSKKEAELLPALASGDSLDIDSAQAKQLFARPPARYTEGSLVKKLEDLGIGRPSTYATIIDTVQTRGYVERGDSEGEPRDIIVLEYSSEETTREIISEKTGSDKGKLIPTPAGELIADFLSEHFTKIVDYGFTAQVEEEFDQIAIGALAKTTMLHSFYKPFHQLVEDSGAIERGEVGENREIGMHPKHNRPIFARFGRFGPMLQLGSTEDTENKPQFAPLPKGRRIDNVTLEDALKAFELPRTVGETDKGEEILANIGRFGPYIKVGKLFVSIKPYDPHTITLEQAQELYAEKLKQEAEKNIADFGDGIKVLNGRYGPYVTDGKKNAKIGKDEDPKKITHEQAKELLEAAPARKGRAKRTTKKPAKKKK